MNWRRLTALVVLVAVMGLCTIALAEEEGSILRRTVYVKYTEPRLLATMKHKGPYEEIPAVVDKVMAEVVKGNHLLAGPVMVLYFNSPQNVPASDLEWEVGIPVVVPGAISKSEFDKVGFNVMESIYVAYKYHVGPYEKVGDTYATLFDWIEKNKYPLSGFPIEVYWSDPKTTPQEKLVTEVWLPITERETPGIKR